MQFISSDTNIWIDFSTIQKIDLPFKLPYIYLMDKDAVEEELTHPKDLRDKLLALGLRQTEIDNEEFQLAEKFGSKYKRLSVYDRIALAIAQNRKIILLTGDGALRKAAQEEKVIVKGTIGLLDELYQGRYISKAEYGLCLTALKHHNGVTVRLPEDEIEKRLAGL